MLHVKLMSSPLEGNETMSSNTHPPSEVHPQAPTNSSQLEGHSEGSRDHNEEKYVIKKKRKKTSTIWKILLRL